MKKLIVPRESEGKRLLTFLKEHFKTDFSQKDIRYAIEHYRCRINGKVERFESTKVRSGSQIEIEIQKKPTFIIDKSRLLYDDPHLCIYNKEAGIPSTGENSLESLMGFSAVHRLDRDTSGLILFAKEEKVKAHLENLFRDRKVFKSYLALVLGVPLEKKGVIENFLGKISQGQGEVKWGVVAPPRGVEAKTEWRLEKAGRKLALLRMVPRSGRTHQIRVHLSGMGHPILGDYRYGSRNPEFPAFRPFLHAEKIAFQHPLLDKRVDLRAPLPLDFEEALTNWIYNGEVNEKN